MKEIEKIIKKKEKEWLLFYIKYKFSKNFFEDL